MKNSGISIFLLKFLVFNLFGLFIFVVLRYAWDYIFDDVQTWSSYLIKEALWLIPLLPLYIYTHFKLTKFIRKDPNYVWHHNFFSFHLKSNLSLNQLADKFSATFPKAMKVKENSDIQVFRLKSRPISRGEIIEIKTIGTGEYEFLSRSPWFNLLDFGVNYKNCYLFIQNLKKKT